MTPRHDLTLLTDEDRYLFNEGTHRALWRCLGGRPDVVEGEAGGWFAVWAPNASFVSVVGDWNGWDGGADPLASRGDAGIWEAFVPGAVPGHTYKYRITNRQSGEVLLKADPLASCSENPPATGSVLWQAEHTWGDDDWMASRAERQQGDAPISTYEMHMGSWLRNADGWALGYRDIAGPLIEHLHRCGFTHVELLPVMEHPFHGSWGYQVTGFFCPTRRYGDPEDLMWLIDQLHQAGIAVILDWVPSHFPTDAHGLARFDGSHLYEHADPRLGFHPDWGSLIFNYGRHEVRSFLLSSAHCWLERFHADGLRVDAVASMLYLDYSRKAGEWIPNQYGGRENLDAIRFLRELNIGTFGLVPGTTTIAEESTAWPMVSRPTDIGGLGFGFKWDMGWMHDTLQYLQRDPIHRRYHHGELTFRSVYATSESYVLPLSHDEVVHGKGSLLSKMPGDEWQQRANLRLLLGYEWTTPGKKLLFMGGELGQRGEWAHDGQLDWWLLDRPEHVGILQLVSDLNELYRGQRAMHVGDCHAEGFRWLEGGDADASVFAFLRLDPSGQGPPLVVAVNATPTVHRQYRLGVPCDHPWQVLLDTDDPAYGGSGAVGRELLQPYPVATHGQWSSVLAALPPLGVLVLGPAAP
jgi:1,4-alpha-glucan branching enzyme